MKQRACPVAGARTNNEQRPMECSGARSAGGEHPWSQLCFIKRQRSRESQRTLTLAYHLKVAHDGARTSLLDSPVALIELYRRDHQRKAWTDVGGVGVVRRLDLQVSLSLLSHGHVKQEGGGAVTCAR